MAAKVTIRGIYQINDNPQYILPIFKTYISPSQVAFKRKLQKVKFNTRRQAMI